MGSGLYCYDKVNKYNNKASHMVLEIPPKIQDIDISLSCPPELESKTLWLKTLHRQVTEHGTIKLVLIRKLPPDWLSFIGAVRVLCRLLVGNFNNLTQL